MKKKEIKVKHVKRKGKRHFLSVVASPFFRDRQRAERLRADSSKAVDYWQNFNSVLIIYLEERRGLAVHTSCSRNLIFCLYFAYAYGCLCMHEA